MPEGIDLQSAMTSPETTRPETSHPETTHYDLIIIGGGLAGASLAVALKHQLAERQSAGECPGYRIAVVEAFAPDDRQQPSYDDRSIALSWGSRLIYQHIGIWPAMATYAQAIETIHISDRGHFGVTRLTAEQEAVEALGYVVENRPMGKVLFERMTAATGETQTPESSLVVDLYCPAELSSLRQDEARVHIELTGTRYHAGEQADNHADIALSADMLVAADGNRSRVMSLLNIGSTRQDYKQSALITNITPGHSHGNVAYERFTETGPLAMLPLTDNRCSVVWTLPPEQAESLRALDDDAFRQQLQQAFGFRLGEMRKVGKRVVYPLFLQAASEMIHGRVAILGNAAHSVHPVAGQGFNLALRDVALLTELITDQLGSVARDKSVHARSDQGQSFTGLIDVHQLLQDYAIRRKQDIHQVYRFTDTLVKLFSNAITPLAHARSCGLLMVDLMPDIKHTLAAHSMGMSGGNLSQLRLLREAAHKPYSGMS